jgi:hypothetical protein
MPVIKIKKPKRKVKKIHKKKTKKDGKITQKQTLINVNINTKSKSKKTKTRKLNMKNSKLDAVNKSQIPITHNGTLQIERKDQNDTEKLKNLEDKISDGIKEFQNIDKKENNNALKLKKIEDNISHGMKQIENIINHKQNENNIINNKQQKKLLNQKRKIPEFFSKKTSLQKLGLNEKTFDTFLKDNPNIDTKITPSGRMKYNITDFMFQINENIKKFTEYPTEKNKNKLIIDKPIVNTEKNNNKFIIEKPIVNTEKKK